LDYPRADKFHLEYVYSGANDETGTAGRWVAPVGNGQDALDNLFTLLSGNLIVPYARDHIDFYLQEGKDGKRWAIGLEEIHVLLGTNSREAPCRVLTFKVGTSYQ
jgi:hypothetical protein